MTRARNSANLASHGNLFVDIANDRTGIGSVVPGQNLHVAGTAGFHADVTFTGDLYNTIWDRSDNSLKFADQAKAKFGSDSDIIIRHDPSMFGSVYNRYDHYSGNVWFVNRDTTNKYMYIRSDDIQLRDWSGNKAYIHCANSLDVKLFYNNSERFITTTYGTNTTGTAVNDGLVVAGVATVTTMNVTGVLTYDDVTSVDSVGIVTARQGVRVNVDSGAAAAASATNYISVGASQDLKIYHDGSHSRITNNTGFFALQSDQFTVNNLSNTQGMIRAFAGGAAELYHNGNKKLETTTRGIKLSSGLASSGGMSNMLQLDNLGNNNGDGSKLTFSRAGTIRTEIEALKNETANNETDIIFRTTNAGSLGEKLRITSGGRLLIATTTEGHSNADDLTIATAAGSLGNTGITIRSSTTGDGNIFFSDATSGDGETKGVIKYAHNGDSLRFNTAGLERVRIDSDGDVIIGTDSWQYKKPLNVQGSSGHIISLYNGDTGTYAANTLSGIEFKLRTGNTGNQIASCEIRAFKENGTNGDSARALSFYTGNNGGSPVERLVIASTGYVKTKSELWVGGASPVLRLRDTTHGEKATMRIDGSSHLLFEVANVERFRMDTGGRLFTGGSTQVLDSTAGALHLHGGTAGGRLAFRGTTTSASTGIAEVFAFWDTNKVAGMVAKSGTDTTNKDDGSLHFYTNTGSGISERVSISSNGRVQIAGQNAIAATSLTHRLLVRAQNDSHAIAIAGRNGDHIGELTFYQSDASTRMGEIQAHTTHLEVTSRLGYLSLQAGGPTERVRIASSGDVTMNNHLSVSGITTSTTGFVFGSGGAHYLYESSSDRVSLRITSDGPYAEFKDVSGDVQMGSASGTLRLSAGGNEKVRIDSSGNVNIGVNASSNPFTYLRFGASLYGAADVRPYNAGSHMVGLSFYTDRTQDNSINPTEQVRFTTEGNFKEINFPQQNSSTYVQRVYRTEVSTNANTFVKFATVTGPSFRTHIKMSCTSTIGNVVTNAEFDIQVGHHQDILVTSRSLAYTQMGIKIISDNNQNFDLYIRRSGGAVQSSNSNHRVVIHPQLLDVVNFNSTVNYSSKTHEHFTESGTMKITGTGGPDGNIKAQGSITGNSKNFSIPHPLSSLTSTKKLVHASIEAPQLDLIYRGKVTLSSGSATVNIDTVSGMSDGTFVALNRDVQCFTTNETGWSAVKGSVSGNVLTITSQDSSSTDTISWMVVGERQDDGAKLSDTTDDSGNLIVESLIEEDYDTSSLHQYYPT